MSDPEGMLKVLETHTIKCALGLDRDGLKGGLIVGGEYAWFTNGADLVLYSKTTGCVESSRSFGQTDNSMEITFVQELHKSEKTMNMLLVGCSSKSFGILFVCQLPTLSTIRCIHTPSPISYISTINNESLAQDQLCDVFKVMSTILLLGLATGSVFAVDLRKHHIENQLRSNEIVVNESSPSKLFILRKNNNSQEAKKISDDCDFHLAMFINENFHNFYNKQCSGKLNFSISCLLYTEEINAVAIGYITGHFQLWDCKIMQTLYVLNKPECLMPISHITFLEEADDPHKLCYLWIIQSDNSRLPNAMMIALSYEHRTLMSNGRFSYRAYKEYNIKFKMSLQKDSGIGRCISALTLCNDTLVRKSTDMSENFGITLFTMLIEIRQNVDASPKSYVFLFDINQWYKAKMPSVINHLKVSKPYASFVKLPDYASYLDFSISNKTLGSFGSNFRNNVKNLYCSSSIYFECDCLSDTKIIRFKHDGVQQEVLDKLILKNWCPFFNPSLIFHQCLQKNLKPFFWDKTYDYENYSLLDKLHFVISIIVENNMMSVIDELAEKWKNGTHSEVIILHLVQCLWNHVMLVKQYADRLCVPLFECSGMLDGKKNVSMLNDCLSQMLRVENFFKRMQLTDCVQITNVDLVDRVKIINLVTQYFNAIIYFVNFQLLPKQIEENGTHQIIQCDFTSLVQYACKRRMEFGNLPLYLIDAIVTNEPNGNKLIEQWKLECIEENKGLYPPSNIQCLLRIYLNAELSNQMQDFITIYFLIDVCSVQKMDEITANIFNNTFVKNEELYKLCCASWLFDHDMFEDGMLILASSNEWMVNDKSWNWYHWTVLRLFVFKEQYYWAQIYFELFNIKLMNLDDHKFYINLQIMNNHCFDALCHLHLRKIEDKKILFEYIFDRCRHTSQLKAFLSYPMDADEKQLFFSCLKKFEDTYLIQFMFLVQEKRYSEALEVYKLLKIKSTSKHDYILTIASVLVNKIKDNISPNNKSDVNKRLFSNEEIKMTFANCFMDNHINMKKSNICRSYGKFCHSNLIVPDDDIVGTTQGPYEKVSAINGVLSPLKIETAKKMKKELLKLLDTPLIQSASYRPSITNCLVVPKKKSAIDNKQLSMIKLDKMRQTLTPGLPDNNDSKVEKCSLNKSMSMKIVDSENKVVENSDTNNLPINMITEQTLMTSHKFLKDNSEIEVLETLPISYTIDGGECEKMDISDSDQNSIPNGENENNFEEADVILEIEHFLYAEEPDIILGDLNETNSSEQPNDLLDGNLNAETHSNETSIMPCDENEDNLKELEDLNDDNNPQQPDIKLIGVIDENLEESVDLLHRSTSLENHSDQPIVIPESEDENNLDELYVIFQGEQFEHVEEPYIILDDSNDTNNSGSLDDLPDDDVNVENNSYQLNVLPSDENEDNLEEPDIILEGEIDGNFEDSVVLLDGENKEHLEESDFILEGENNENTNKTDFILDDDDDDDVENRSDQPNVLNDGENEENFKKPCVIPRDENEDNVEVPKMILDEANDTNNLESPGIMLEGEIDGRFEESEDLLEGENYEKTNKTGFILDDVVNVENQSDQPSVSILPDCEDKDNLVEPYFTPKGKNKDNLGESNDFLDTVSVEHDSDQPIVLLDDDIEDNIEVLEMTLDDANDTNNSEQPDVILENDIYENFVESDNFLDDVQSVGNRPDQPCVLADGNDESNFKKPYDIPYDENEDNVEIPEMILVDINDTHNLEQPDIILEDEIDGCFEESEDLLDGENEDSKEEPDFILDSNNTNNLEEQGVILNNNSNVQNDSDQLSVKPDGENKDSLEEPDVIFESEYKENSEEAYASEQNLTTYFETFKNEITPKNNGMIDRGNVIYSTDSQSNKLKNLTPCNHHLTEENRLNCDNKIIEEENKSYIHNIVDGNKNLFVIKKDDIAEIVENTNGENKSSEPIHFQIFENPKNLCGDQNEDYLYDEYQYSNNDIFSEVSTIENPIPEYGFNHLTMTENESNQLEVYDTLNQQTSVLLNESFLNNISLGTTAEVNEPSDLIENNVEIVTDKISVDLEPSSNTNLYNEEIKSFQLVDSNDITPQQVDINILDSETKEYAVEIQNSCPVISSEPSKTLIIEEFPPNSMFYKDIIVQGETSKLVNLVKSSSDTEIDNNLSENVYNLRKVKKNKQPLIEQVEKNIPNLRKRRSRAKCIPLTDTKLTTKSKSECKTKQVELEIISSPASDIVEDSLNNVSKKRLKCQKKIPLVKRRRVCPKYVASVDGASNSEIDLEQSEEMTANQQKKVKKIKELLPNKNKVTASQKELKKLAMPTKIKLDSENNNKILDQNTVSSTKTCKHLFLLEPKIVLERLDISSFKNCFKQLAVPNDSSQVTLSTNKTNSQKPVALKRLRNGCLKSIKEPTVINTIIDSDKELKKDSINNDKKKTVTRKSKLNSSYREKKVELDNNLTSSSNKLVLTSSKSDPINCVNKIHNSLINETIDLTSDGESVSDEDQEEMAQTKSSKEKLDWRIISHEVKTNTDAIPKIRIGRNKSELNTKCVDSLLDLKSMKQGTKIVEERELGLIKKSSETKILKLNQQGRRMSTRRVLKKHTCSCCTSESMDVAFHSNVIG